MRKQILLAVDVGTSSCRASLYTPDGKTVAVASSTSPPVFFPRPSWAEQSPESIWTTLVQVLQKLVGQIDGAYQISGMAISAHLGTICSDASGNPVYPMFSWMDRRATESAKVIADLIGEKEIYARSGKRLDPERDLCRLMWLKSKRPEVWRRVNLVYSLKDFLVHRLTGVAATDPVHASYTLLYDVEKGEWNEGLCRTVGLDLKLLPPVYSPTDQVGRLNQDVARVTGLPEGIPVAAGGPDGTLGMLGIGLVQPGDAGLIMGTSDVFFVCNDKRIVDTRQGLISHRHVLPDTWLVGGPQGLSGGTFSWLMDLLAVSAKPDSSCVDPRSRLEDEAIRLSPGVGGLLFLPSLTGERAPLWRQHVRGAIAGITPSHGPSHVFRAFIEGLAFGTREIIDYLDRNGCRPKQLIVTGGGASDLRLQITADVTGMEVASVENNEVSSAGAAILAGIATDILDTSTIRQWVRIKKRYFPNAEAQAVYNQLYPVWQQWCTHQSKTMEALLDLESGG